MALVAPPVHDRKRVKVYELKSNDWFDRGTGFCTGTVVNVSDPPTVKHPFVTDAKTRLWRRLHWFDGGMPLSTRSWKSSLIQHDAN